MALVWIFLGISCLASQHAARAFDWPESASGEYRFGSVTTDNELCSTIGTAIMTRHGGSAVDAAIASLICVGAVNQQSSGIGGGFVFTIYDPSSDEVDTLIARESAPLFAHPEMFAHDPDARVSGPLSIMVPREIWGYWEAWQKYGRVEWPILFEDTIRMCRNGWPVSQHMANAIVGSLDEVLKDPGLRGQYLHEDDTPYKAGEIIRDLPLANTLEIIAMEGPHAFYSGSLAPIIVNELHSYGAVNYTLADLESQYQVPMWYDPLVIDLPHRNYRMYAPTTPSSGPLIQFIMRVLDGYGFTPDDYATLEGRSLLYHRTLEAFKFAFTRRYHLEDIEFGDDEMLEWIDRLTDGEYCDQIRGLINDSYVLDDYAPQGSEDEYYDYDLSEWLESQRKTSTTHLNTMSGDGMVVSATATVGAHFGSKTRGEITGIVYNNMMNLFHTPAMNVPRNWPEALKRGHSSTVPVLIFNNEGHVYLSVGGAGGAKIITSSVMVMEKFLWLGLDLERSVSAPTLYDDFTGPALYEDNFEQEVLDILVSKGHQLEVNDGNLAVENALSASKCHLCWNDPSCRSTCIVGVSDWRKWGAPDGF